jgi:hypothetical protein
LGIRSLLRRYHGGELEIPVSPAHRFLNRDCIVFDGGGVAFREAGSYASVALVIRQKDTNSRREPIF